MPIYPVKCPQCGYTGERVCAMKDVGKPYICDECGARMNRDWSADVPFISGGEYHKAIHSDSLAISPDQRAAHEKQFPYIKLDSECRPIFDNFQDHDKYLKATNFKKERQRIRRKTKKLPTPKVTKCVAK